MSRARRGHFGSFRASLGLRMVRDATRGFEEFLPHKDETKSAVPHGFEGPQAAARDGSYPTPKAMLLGGIVLLKQASPVVSTAMLSNGAFACHHVHPPSIHVHSPMAPAPPAPTAHRWALRRCVRACRERARRPSGCRRSRCRTTSRPHAARRVHGGVRTGRPEWSRERLLDTVRRGLARVPSTGVPTLGKLHPSGREAHHFAAARPCGIESTAHDFLIRRLHFCSSVRVRRSNRWLPSGASRQRARSQNILSDQLQNTHIGLAIRALNGGVQISEAPVILLEATPFCKVYQPSEASACWVLMLRKDHASCAPPRLLPLDLDNLRTTGAIELHRVWRIR